MMATGARKEWDDMVVSIETFDQIGCHINLVDKKFKAPIPVMSDRQQLEKNFVFTHNHKNYLYMSSLPENFIGKDTKYSRVPVVFGIAEF